MAITTKSDFFTGPAASPQSLLEGAESTGVIHIARPLVEIAAVGDFNAANEGLQIIELPSHARLHSITVSNDAIGTGAAGSMGVLKMDGTEPVASTSDVSLDASVSIASAATDTNAFDKKTLDNETQALWEWAGYSTAQDAPTTLMIAMTWVAGAANSGTLRFHVKYSL